MFRWIYLEIKQMLFNRKNIMIFLLLLVVHLLVLSYFSTDDDIVTNKIQEYTVDDDDLSLRLFLYDEASLKAYKEKQQLNEKLLTAISEDDTKEYNKLILIEQLKYVNRIERYLLSIENPEYGSLKEKIDSYYHNHKLHLKLKEKIFNEFGYMDDNIDIAYDLSIYNSKVSHLQYKFEVFDRGFMQYDEPSRNSMTITLTLFRQYLMFIVVLIPLIVGFDAFLKDKKDGSIRSIMALSQKRYKYFLVKLLAALIVSLLIIILPLILALVINNVNIISDLNYPNYVYTKGFTSFEAISPIMESKGVFIDYNANYMLDQYSFHSRAVFNLNEYGYIIGVHDGVELLSLKHMIIFSFILITFLVLFVLSIQLSLSLNFNESLGLLITFVFLAILYLFSLNMHLESLETGFLMFRHVTSIFERMNPMSYLKAIDVVEGTVPFTFLGGIFSLGMYTTIIVAISSGFLKKKDIKD